MENNTPQEPGPREKLGGRDILIRIAVLFGAPIALLFGLKWILGW